MGFIETLLRNPFTLWISWLSAKIYYKCRYARNHLAIGYMAQFSDCKFGNYNTLYKNAKLTNVALDDFSYVGRDCAFANTSIGKFVCIGPEVICGLGRHPSRDFVSIHPIFYSPLRQSQLTFASRSYFDEFDQVYIGNDVWIGVRAIILGGIKIGDGAIVGAGALVTADVPAYAIVGGVPAKVLRYRFEPAEIEFLMRFKWWERDVDWLRQHAASFHSISTFMDTAS